ncbi:MAG: hypothetical protein MI919_29910, partial [Holophagales bacterium]|nr:hypothetical protein [Holophagales bacterium]
RAGGTPALRQRFGEWTSGLPDDSRAWIDHAWTRDGLDDLSGSVYPPACHCWWGGEVGVGGVPLSQGGFLAEAPSDGAPASCRLFLFAEAGETPALRQRCVGRI